MTWPISNHKWRKDARSKLTYRGSDLAAGQVASWRGVRLLLLIFGICQCRRRFTSAAAPSRCRSARSTAAPVPLLSHGPRLPPLPIHPRTQTNQRQMRNASRWQGLDWNDGTPMAQQAVVAALAASAGRVVPASVHPRIESGRTDRRHTRTSQIS